MGYAGRGIEVAVLAHELLERVEELEAPLRVGRAGNALAGDVDVHRRGVGQYRLIERVGMTSAAGHGCDPGWSVFQRRLEPELGCSVALRHDAVGPDERQVLGP